MKGLKSIGAWALPVAFGLLATAGAAQAATLGDLTGTWAGSLTNQHGAAAPIIVHIMADGSGTVDSPAQDVFGVALDELTVEHNLVSFTAPHSNASYHGMLDGDMSAIDGQWQRNGNTLPLRLVRRNAIPEP